MMTDDMGGLYDSLFSTEQMSAVFSDRATIQTMLDFERALANANARVGLIPTQAALVIQDHCDAAAYDLASLATGAALSGNLAIPLVAALTSAVASAVASADADAARYVHWGATSQDAIDTSLVMRIWDGLALIEEDLEALIAACERLAREHAATPMAGRTWLQQSTPITFGLKVAGWLSAARRSQERLRELRPRALVLQLGGASGSLAAFGPQGLAVAAALAAELSLAEPDLPWHTQRDRIVEVATTLGLLVGSLGKIARDVSLLAQSEIAEVSEPGAPGKGGSSTMPQKRNPVGSAVALAAAQRAPNLVATLLGAMPQEHERGLGGWQAEWQVIPEMFRLTAGALRRMVEVVSDLVVDPIRMRANLDASEGLIYAEAVAMALAEHVGKAEAHRLLRQASERARAESRPLRAVLTDDELISKYFSGTELDSLFDPLQASGLAQELVKRVVK